MKRIVLAWTLLAFIILGLSAKDLEKTATIRDGAYYGTNYTVPFAHAYRALGELGVDRKVAIDRDVYHFARLGLNAYRLHLWDVELSDGEGNLLEKDNEHLELLDYLLGRLSDRGIAVVLTAQTNFGNGYPEANTDPNDAYSYDYPKCEVHDNPAAQNAQARYLEALVNHINPNTGMSYKDDSNIIAIEINNEPCHSGTQEEITAYVNRMSSVLRSAGWEKEILYNVSHNLERSKAFYDADIDGTTYQWYPTGLVHGKERKGNFLPFLDGYFIPFDTIAGYADKSRVIYEYDPADVLATYLYPAATRTFRKAGFNWVTQFAYDPIDMAKYNTEYQTHFLNLAYTPGKAIGMMIAAEVMRNIPSGKDYGKYPVDTIFDDFLVSARRNLAMLNDGTRYYHTNSTTEAPKNLRKLRAIAGVGSSPLVATDGTGAYFLDLIDAKNGVWRLEVMPNVVITCDPFAKTSLRQSVAEIMPGKVTLDLSGLLGREYAYLEAIGGAPVEVKTSQLSIDPGVYLIAPGKKSFDSINPDASFGLRNNMKIKEFVTPATKIQKDILVHAPVESLPMHKDLRISAVWVGENEPDSIVIYPARASFWNAHNDLYRLQKDGKYSYAIDLSAKEALGRHDNGCFDYRIVVFNHDGTTTTYPGGVEGTPLDWDYASENAEAAVKVYSTNFVKPESETILLAAAPDLDDSELSTIPEAWRGVDYSYHAPVGQIPSMLLHKEASAETDTLVVTKNVRAILSGYTPEDLNSRKSVKVYIGEIEGRANIGLVTLDGFTYTAPLKPTSEGFIEIPFGELTLDDTLLIPAPYPAFLKRRFTPNAETAVPFRPSDIESVVITLTSPAGTNASLPIRGVVIP